MLIDPSKYYVLVFLGLDGVAHQDVPDILIGSLVAAEADTGTEQTLSSPHVAGHHLQLTDPRGFGAVNLHLHYSLHVGLQELLQQLIFLILVKKKKKNTRAGYVHVPVL